MGVHRFKMQRKTNSLGQTVHASMVPNENGNFVDFDDYTRLLRELEKHEETIQQLKESMGSYRGSTVRLRNEIESVLSKYNDHAIWPTNE